MAPINRAKKIGEITIPELKVQLRQRKARVSGRKQELVDRLESYIRNENFGPIVEPDDFEIELPGDVHYRDVNSESQLPPITEEQVFGYLSLFEQDLRDNAVGMYKGKFLRSVRLAKTDATYIWGRVSSKYRKKTIYRVDLKLDDHGVVLQCQCECTVGVGPEAHCKHIALVYYALTKAKDGIVTMETCTQQLQTFHQVKSTPARLPCKDGEHKVVIQTQWTRGFKGLGSTPPGEKTSARISCTFQASLAELICKRNSN